MDVESLDGCLIGTWIQEFGFFRNIMCLHELIKFMLQCLDVECGIVTMGMLESTRWHPGLSTVHTHQETKKLVVAIANQLQKRSGHPVRGMVDLRYSVSDEGGFHLALTFLRIQDPVFALFLHWLFHLNHLVLGWLLLENWLFAMIIWLLLMVLMILSSGFSPISGGYKKSRAISTE